jgi:hypothetical protein
MVSFPVKNLPRLHSGMKIFMTFFNSGISLMLSKCLLSVRLISSCVLTGSLSNPITFKQKENQKKTKRESKKEKE